MSESPWIAAMAGRSLPSLVLFGITSLLTVSCAHRPPVTTAAAAPMCAPPAAVVAPGKVRIDGWLGPAANDSLVIIVDGVERWRGLYRLCSEAPTPATAFPWMPTVNSVLSLEVVSGAGARQRFGIGGYIPSALLITTSRPAASSKGS